MVRETRRESSLARTLARRLRASRLELTRRWLERIVQRASIPPRDVFPTHELLDHVPILIDGIADYLENPGDDVRDDMLVVSKAKELGALRHAQGFGAREILEEYETLGGILFTFLSRDVDEVPNDAEKGELLECAHRLFRAISVVQQTTTMHYLRLADERVDEREGRLVAFNRAVSHEIRNRIGSALSASDTLINVPTLTSEQRTKFLGIVSRNLRSMHGTVENLLALSRLEHNVGLQRTATLREAVQEAERQVREGAEAACVELRIAADLPDVHINAAAVELCLTNYLANAIKYCDARKPLRFVEVSAAVEQWSEDVRELVVRVRDNGLGVPEAKRDRLFQRFFRAHESDTGAQGMGLGLAIVRETAESLGGRAWAEFPEEGCVFAFALPLTVAVPFSLPLPLPRSR